MSTTTSSDNTTSSGGDVADNVHHPKWHVPQGSASGAPLVINNSLTDAPVPFVPIDKEGKRITWYSCGPTVYDSAHLGHARSYVTFDIIQRILTDYFGYEMFYVMNITDIDDKIILRARRNYLFEQYKKEGKSLAQVRAEATAAYDDVIAKAQAAVARGKEDAKKATKRELADAEERVKMAELKLKNWTTARDASAAIAEEKSNEPAENTKERYLASVKDVLSVKIDAEKGASVTDQEIFRKHAAYYENEFLEDMANLGVREPTVLTRVTEYVEDIVEYVKKIIDNGFAYESNGSVYFRTQRFDASGHNYAKLAPEMRNNLALLNEGEGALGDSGAGEKEAQSDFALWKKSKPGEPSWQSPWGLGRPGWHIECSVMASDHLGANFDFHSGGEDLKFPHHDNELAQAEAHFGCQQWVNYFLHAGHLHIGGLKMSKSLKNFTTIRNILANYTSRQVRMLFLLQGWDRKMMFNEDSLKEALSKETTFNEFFGGVKAAIRASGSIGERPQAWHKEERDLHKRLVEVQGEVHRALLNNFDFSTAVASLLDLVAVCNAYLRARESGKHLALLLREVAKYVDRILRVFGMMPDGDFGFQAGAGGANREETLAPTLDVLAAFRAKVRSLAKSNIKDPAMREMLELCDNLRDHVLPEVGVKLEDGAAGAAGLWKLGDPVELIRQRDEKIAQERENAMRKLRNKIASAEKDLAKWALHTRDPKERTVDEFKDKWSEFDDAKRLPTKDAEGNDAPAKANSGMKAVKKFWNKAQKEFDALQKKLAKNANLVEDRRSELAELRAKLAKFENEQ